MQISKLSILSFALALAISLPAAAQSSATNPSSQSAPAQAAPTQTAPAPQSSTQQSAPSTASPNSAQAQANEDNPLNLTDEQKTKLRPIIADENQQMEALRNDNSISQAQKIDKANQIRAQASPKIKAILTPEQLQKLAQLQQDRVRQQQQDSQPATPPSNSQAPPK
jgi:Spy/CpxP family protein refolding chaperone